MVTIGTQQYYTVADVAEHHKVSTSAVYMATRNGNLQCTVILDRLLYTEEQVNAWQPTTHGGGNRGAGRKPKDRAAIPP